MYRKKIQLHSLEVKSYLEDLSATLQTTVYPEPQTIGTGEAIWKQLACSYNQLLERV